MPALLAAENVGCRARGKQILDDVSLAIEARDFVTLIGPNGAGKTQLIKILLGILPPSEGKVVRQPGVRIGYMPQDFVPSVALPLTVRRFVQLNHARTAATKAATEAAVEATGIQPLLNALLSDLSGGERQLVLLARALSGDPQLLILDEPAQNLDLAAQQNLYRLVQDLYQTRALAVLMVSHDLHFVMAESRRVICLYQHICCSGTPRKVASDPHVQKLFGAPLAQLMAVYPHAGKGGTHSHAHVRTSEPRR